MSVAIGIDLGTTFTCMAVSRSGKVEIIPNRFGHRITPSMVAFNENERLVGDSARQQAHTNYENTVFDAKRLIGCKFSDKVIQDGMKHWPFNIIDVDGIPKFSITFKKKPEVYSPEEISSMVLIEMKQIAESYLGQPVESAVITVPAYFNDMQRKATKVAAEIAQLNVLRIINEPTAACIAFGLSDIQDGERTVLVYDLGGGTFDVSVVKIKKKDFEVLATGGDTHLGGEDFDRRMVEHCVDDFLRKHKIDIKSNKKALGKLRRACEMVKKTLSVNTVAYVDVESLANDIDYNTSISRATFEELNADLFQFTIQTLKATLKDAKIDKSAIDEILLVGGSTRIPKIQILIKDFFGKDPVKTINPDEAVAQGAAIIAAKLIGDRSNEIVDVAFKDVTSLSLGVAVLGEKMSTIIERNSKVPTKFTKCYYTVSNNQTTINFRVFQGESKAVKDNFFLGNFIFTGIPPKPSGVEEIDVTFDIDDNGILDVTAVLRSTKKKMNIIIDIKGNLSKQQIDGMIRETRQLTLDDDAKEASNVAKNGLEMFCFTIKKAIEQKKRSDFPQGIYDQMLAKCAETLMWIEETDVTDKIKCRQQQDILRSFCAPYLSV